MNNQAYYEETTLFALYKIEQISTNDLEAFFDKVDPQLANNVISNRHNKTSYIKTGYMHYDETDHILSITKQGKEYVQGKFAEHRSSHN
ncbi:hypothetical protein PVA45_05355 [Entomospira entomophila]|uniref:Uncharacterized protein n=1 Tax=Entomospira entomophila TaxID=2719988 RepID=A0A968GAA4_9SPIO|nr:hypothetical protein [Entomospira entomophilus]NIZ40926.1 hypothetical protein [Entomospira entomophilus]WDI35139.1 hypothetical protein PVA45_05355 [Entomospira entomophilus]